MFIQTEETPNPNALKFIPGSVVMPTGTATFTDVNACAESPFAERLLKIEGVVGVFFGYDFISITKTPETDWYLIKPALLGAIMEQFIANIPVIGTNIGNKESNSPKPLENDPITTQIKDIIDTRVRPAVAQDGGDIIFDSFDNGVVYLTLQGACSGCPSSSATLKDGIENMLRHYVPEVTEVRATS